MVDRDTNGRMSDWTPRESLEVDYDRARNECAGYN